MARIGDVVRATARRNTQADSRRPVAPRPVEMEGTMTNQFVEDLRIFHEKFGLVYEGPPRLLPPDLFKFRSKFLGEELQEFIDATQEEMDLAKAFDALVDITYVAIGTAYLMGLPFERGWELVQAANMRKVRAAIDGSDSKRGSGYDVVKPGGWAPPDLRPLLFAHGGQVEYTREEYAQIERGPNLTRDDAGIICFSCGKPHLQASLDCPSPRLTVGFEDPRVEGAAQWAQWLDAGDDTVYGLDPKYMKKRPLVITLCGSTRFKDAFIRENFRLTMEGAIVLSVGFFSHADPTYTCTEEEKTRLDILHKQKIDMSDRILVLNVGGYIGDSTASEIAHALEHGVEVEFLEPLNNETHSTAS
jgi:predicted HAD superfamily Cof-like phosphohydrolase